jgi:hypothetical protein
MTTFRTGDAREDHKRIAGDVERHVLEIVFPRTTNPHKPVVLPPVPVALTLEEPLVHPTCLAAYQARVHF